MQNTSDPQLLGKIVQAIGETPPSIYYPSDDSYLMIDALAKLPIKGKKVLEIGTGSGILALFCASHGGQVTATDVDESALARIQKAAEVLELRIGTRVSDLFSTVRGQFDLVIFNPPYLPSSTIDDRTVDGGSRGTNLSERFLEELPAYLERDGTALLLASSLNETASWPEQYSGFQFSVIARRSLFFEELRVLGVRFREDFTGQRFDS